MKRKSIVMTAILSAVLLGIGATVAAAPIEVGGFAPEAGCNAPMVRVLDGGNVFLAASNSLSKVSAAGVFEGCWTYWPAGPCRAIYRQGQSYTICGVCDDGGNPGSGGCSSISIRTLNRGYWCS